MSNTKSGRTPFEVRLELLQLATSILLERHRALASASNKHLSAIDLLVSTSPTTDEIIAEANKLNDFVSNGSR